MPKKGYKGITIKESVYDGFARIYESQKTELEKQGITSMAGYLTWVMYQHTREQDDKKTK